MAKDSFAYSNSDEVFRDSKKMNNEDFEKKFSEYLKRKVNQNQDKKTVVNLESDSQKTNGEERINNLIKNVNNEFLLNVLSPEIKKNEEKKRKHKDWLMLIMGGFLLFQFLLVAAIICCFGYFVINAHIKGNPFSDSTVKIILTFIGMYITSLIVELIAILKYIVKNVFDTSVAGMVDNFKE